VNPRILCVDDDRELCEMLGQFLRPRGFDIAFERTGANGLARALSNAFDLAVLDVMLPGLDGFEVLRQLRAQSPLPVLMLTARGDHRERVKGLELGADDYLPKPFDPDELAARMLAILRRINGRLPPTAVPLEVGELKLVPGSRAAYFRGRDLGLTAMESEILESLMRSSGRVVSRDQLTLQLYNRESSPLDRSIDTHVSRIRRKIGADQEIILSVRGTGYQLRLPEIPIETEVS
jgi:two-component system response regulator CpxR